MHFHLVLRSPHEHVCIMPISHLSPAPLSYTLHAAHCKFLGSYIISINDPSVSATSNIDVIHTHLRSSEHQNFTTLTMVIAPEWQSSFDDCPLPTQLQVHDLWHISALWLLTREGMTVEANQSLSNHLKNLWTDHMDFIINHLGMIPLCLYVPIPKKNGNLSSTIFM